MSPVQACVVVSKTHAVVSHWQEVAGSHMRVIRKLPSQTCSSHEVASHATSSAGVHVLTVQPVQGCWVSTPLQVHVSEQAPVMSAVHCPIMQLRMACLLYTSDAADD